MRIGAALFALAAVYFAPLGAEATHGDVQDRAAAIAKGKQIYGQHCAACHGANLEGPENPKEFGKRVPPRLDGHGHAGHHDDAYLTRQILRGSRDANGRPVDDGMPPFKDVLSVEAIHDVLSYIRSTWHGSDGHMPGMNGMGGTHGPRGGGHMH